MWVCCQDAFNDRLITSAFIGEVGVRAWVQVVEVFLAENCRQGDGRFEVAPAAVLISKFDISSEANSSRRSLFLNSVLDRSTRRLVD